MVGELEKQLAGTIPTVVAGLVPALIGLLGVCIGLRGRSGADDRQWQREHRLEAYVDFLTACQSAFHAARTLHVTKEGAQQLIDDTRAVERAGARVSLLGSPTMRKQISELQDGVSDVIEGALPSKGWSDLDWSVAQNWFEVIYGAVVQAGRKDLGVQGDWRPDKCGVLRLPRISSLPPIPVIDPWNESPDRTCRRCFGSAPEGRFVCDECLTDYEREAEAG